MNRSGPRLVGAQAAAAVAARRADMRRLDNRIEYIEGQLAVLQRKLDRLKRERDGLTSPLLDPTEEHHDD